MFSSSSLIEQFFSWTVTTLVVLNIFLLIVNLTIWLRSKTNRIRLGSTGKGKKVERKLMAVLGSGGHTTEMFKMLAAQDDLFPHRLYVISNMDKLSIAKVEEFEQIHGNKFCVRTIPRAREVGQNLFSSLGSTIVALCHSSVLVYQERADVIISNGPAIGFGICIFARFYDLLRLHRCRVVFVESICRVQKLSLTGLLLYHLRIAHAFIVQWKDLQKKYPRSEYIGRLV